MGEDRELKISDKLKQAPDLKRITEEKQAYYSKSGSRVRWLADELASVL